MFCKAAISPCSLQIFRCGFRANGNQPCPFLWQVDMAPARITRALFWNIVRSPHSHLTPCHSLALGILGQSAGISCCTLIRGAVLGPNTRTERDVRHAVISSKAHGLVREMVKVTVL